MKFEANRLKIRCWIQSILKMTHFLLPVGGAITLTPNSHIYALGIIQRTKPWSLIKIRQCMWMLLDASCLSFFAINSSPRHGQTVRDIKNILAILRPQCWDHVHQVWWQSGGNPQRSIKFQSMRFLKTALNSRLPVGGAYDMQHESCRLNEIYMCTEFHMNTCKYVWAIHQVFRLCSRGRREPCPRPGPSLCGVLRPRIPMCVQIFKSFEHVKAPKNPRTVVEIKKNIYKK